MHTIRGEWEMDWFVDQVEQIKSGLRTNLAECTVRGPHVAHRKRLARMFVTQGRKNVCNARSRGRGLLRMIGTFSGVVMKPPMVFCLGEFVISSGATSQTVVSSFGEFSFRNNL
jgi:hypothetical protein